MRQIVQAVVNNELEFRVYDNQEIIARFTKQHHAQQFVNRLENRAHILINDDHDVICAFDSEPTMEEVKDQLEQCYSMDLSISKLISGAYYTHYEVHGDNFFETVTIYKTHLL